MSIFDEVFGTTFRPSLQPLRKWKETYMKEREDIEKSDRDQRWEFDRKRLFDTTKYMEGQG